MRVKTISVPLEDTATLCNAAAGLALLSPLAPQQPRILWPVFFCLSARILQGPSRLPGDPEQPGESDTCTAG